MQVVARIARTRQGEDLAPMGRLLLLTNRLERGTLYRTSRHLTVKTFMLQSCGLVGKQVVGGVQLGTG